VKIERVTASVMMKYRTIVSCESVLVSDRLRHGQFTHLCCQFKLSDSQVRLLREFSDCRNLEARVTIQIEMSSRWGMISKSMSNKDILVKPWCQPPNIQAKAGDSGEAIPNSGPE
jgi:hypothetical protein